LHRLADDRKIALLIYPDGRSIQYDPRDRDLVISYIANSPYTTTAAVLETGYGAISSRIAAEARFLFRQGLDPPAVARTMNERYAFNPDASTQWSSLLGAYQERLFQCMGTRKFADDYQKLLSSLRTVRGLRLGVDLEGVLINRRSRDNDLMRTYDIRVKRYLADAFLFELAQGNQVVLVTNLPRMYVQYLLESTDLNLPPSTPMVTLEDLQRINGAAGSETLGLKSPTLLNVNFMLDDFAQRHETEAANSGITTDKGRFIEVPEFMIETPEEIAESYSDPGLLYVAERLKDVAST
jgi:hypothetical protein